jgi:hypothetical protein
MSAPKWPVSHISCTALKKGTPRRTISSMNHRTWGTRCIILVLSHTFCACYIDHRWPHSIVFFVIRFPVVLAKQACKTKRRGGGGGAGAMHGRAEQRRGAGAPAQQFPRPRFDANNNSSPAAPRRRLCRGRPVLCRRAVRRGSRPRGHDEPTPTQCGRWEYLPLERQRAHDQARGAAIHRLVPLPTRRQHATPQPQRLQWPSVFLVLCDISPTYPTVWNVAPRFQLAALAAPHHRTRRRPMWFVTPFSAQRTAAALGATAATG